MKQIRIRQLLNLYNQSYTNRERWQAKAFEALDKQHIKAAIKADTAANYWGGTKNRLYVSLLIASPLQSWWTRPPRRGKAAEAGPKPGTA